MSDLVQKMEDMSVAASAPSAAAASSAVDVSKLSDQELIQFLADQEGKRLQERARKREAKNSLDKDHKFWNTQPVPAIKDTFEGECGPLDPNTDVASVKADPYNMPAGFEWCNIDVNDPAQIEEMYTLLTENYVEDDDCVFRFDYSKAFLQWALMPPGFLQDWHVGVRNQKSGALMGCITAIPARVAVHGTPIQMVEINFLCVHKKLRTKRLAPVLIKEITRRVNLRNIWQATYTAGVVLPKPISRCQYWHRSLNIKKLVEVRFSAIPQRETLASMIKKLKIADRPAHAMRRMESSDAPMVHKLLTAELAK
jgi:glycylpeptide N-tetradecanoyltransferase